MDKKTSTSGGGSEKMTLEEQDLKALLDEAIRNVKKINLLLTNAYKNCEDRKSKPAD